MGAWWLTAKAAERERCAGLAMTVTQPCDKLDDVEGALFAALGEDEVGV